MPSPMLLVSYEVAVVVFVIQGVALPLLLVGSGWLWSRQARAMAEVAPAKWGRRAPRRRSATRGDEVSTGLPKLAPLDCAACGAPASLTADALVCSHCGTRRPLPPDYASLAELRPRLRSLTRRAIRHWWVAWVLTRAPMRWCFTALVFVEPLVLFPAVLIGSNVYPDTWIDHWVADANESVVFVITGLCFVGFVVWMVIFIMLAGLVRGLHTKLPGLPAFAELRPDTRRSRCEGCGGAIEYDARAFAALCDYCHLENLRVRFVARSRSVAESAQLQTRSVLFAAMTIIEDFIGTFFVLMVCLVGIPMAVAVGYALLNAL